MDQLQKLMQKKKPDKDIDPKYKAAKMGVLDHISNMAGDAMGKGLDQLKTVMVGSSDRKGLEDGLDTAKKIVGKSNRPLNTNDFEPGDADEEHNSSDEHTKPNKYANGGMAGGGNMPKGSGKSDQAVDDDDEQSEATEQSQDFGDGVNPPGYKMARGSGKSDQAVSDDDEQSEYTGQTKRYAEGGFSKGGNMPRGNGTSSQAVDDDDFESETDGQGMSMYADGGMSLGNQDNDAMPDSMDSTGDGGLSSEDIDQLIAELQSKKASMGKR